MSEATVVSIDVGVSTRTIGVVESSLSSVHEDLV